MDSGTSDSGCSWWFSICWPSWNSISQCEFGCFRRRFSCCGWIGCRRRNRNNCWRWRSLGGSWVWHSLLNSDGIAHLEGLRCSGVCQTSGLLLLLYQSRANGSSCAEGYTYPYPTETQFPRHVPESRFPWRKTEEIRSQPPAFPVLI